MTTPTLAGRVFDRSRLRLGIVVAVVCGALAFLALQLGGAATYFKNADEAVAEREDLGTDRFRLQGTVVAGSVREVGERVEFTVGYDCAFVDVRHRGVRPELFQPGIPVVLEGQFAPGGAVYESDRIIVRHTSEYRADEAERLELAARDVCGA